MDYKQKYEEALERANKVHKYSSDPAEIKRMEDIFPELAESEGERVRKEFCKDIWTFIPNEKAHKYIAWLEKQGEQKSAEWSKEDDVMVHDILGWLPAKSRPEYNQRRVDWLKSLKGRVHPKQELSEEDENVLEDIEEAIINYWHGDTQDILLDWLKSLKQRHTWKPSEKQIEALEDEVRNNKTVFRKKVLNELLEQLKKL